MASRSSFATDSTSSAFLVPDLGLAVGRDIRHNRHSSHVCEVVMGYGSPAFGVFLIWRILSSIVSSPLVPASAVAPVQPPATNVNFTSRIKRILLLRGSIWFGNRLGRPCSKERRRLTRLVNKVNFPRRGPRSDQGSNEELVGAAPDVVEGQGLREMVAVVVPLVPGAAGEDLRKEKSEEEGFGPEIARQKEEMSSGNDKNGVWATAESAGATDNVSVPVRTSKEFWEKCAEMAQRDCWGELEQMFVALTGAEVGDEPELAKWFAEQVRKVKRNGCGRRPRRKTRMSNEGRQ
ncbi:hypothetical protein AJ78_05554 [Emergomyces pasteurianus Ep9510]|uniref:Uncharacterized protein n=1 Tax=Emergomyces pasteurianus Ep9510 TaxID=1447872 RepID=A0A1J9QFY2_9EURO|nr:hypothetical protein AJ78_05554 [Emergomyces pasteurianus Ep9510]